jgi:hypothetical protein
LDLGLVSSLDFDSRAIYVSDVAAEDLGLRVDSLKVETDKRAGEEVTVLDHHTVVPL